MRPAWWFMLTAVTVATAVAGCPTRGSCAETCDGCCVGTECLPGTSRYTCGSGGEACSECEPRELCQSGACVPDPRVDQDSGQLLCSCGAGCCLPDGGCVPGTQTEACGEAHTLCKVCDPLARCERFECHSEPCAGCLDTANVCQPGTANRACGGGGLLCLGCLPGQRCADGGCVDASCNAASCASGCCNLAQLCVTSSDKACGVSGQACFACPEALRCRDGLCQ